MQQPCNHRAAAGSAGAPVQPLTGSAGSLWQRMNRQIGEHGMFSWYAAQPGQLFGHHKVEIAARHHQGPGETDPLRDP